MERKAKGQLNAAKGLRGVLARLAAVVALSVALAPVSGCSPIGIEVLESGADGSGASVASEAAEGAKQAGEKVSEGARELGEKASEGADAVMAQGAKAVDAAETGIARGWLKACRILRGWAAFVTVLSMLLGFALTEIFPKNAEIRKFGIVTLCVRVPVITIVLTYVMAFLYGVTGGRHVVWTESAALPGRACVAWYEFARPAAPWAIVCCAACIAVGVFLSERHRGNPDVVRTAKRYLCVRVPLAAFLALVAYPVLYSLFA